MKMTCDNFLTLWNEQLDRRSAVSTDRLRELQAHAADCGKCRVLAGGFHVLSQGLLPAPAVPDQLAGKVLSAWERENYRPRLVSRRVIWTVTTGLAAAAALVLAFTMTRPAPRTQPEIAVKPPIPRRPWTSAVADATSATLAFARETSAPAARVGQDVLSVGKNGDIPWPVTWESPSTSSEFIESVSKSVNSRVKPISGSARRAFSFLIAPASGDLAPSDNSRDSGA